MFFSGAFTGYINRSIRVKIVLFSEFIVFRRYYTDFEQLVTITNTIVVVVVMFKENY